MSEDGTDLLTCPQDGFGCTDWKISGNYVYCSECTLPYERKEGEIKITMHVRFMQEWTAGKQGHVMTVKEEVL